MADQRIEVIKPSTLLASASPRSRLLNILRYPHVRPQTFWTSTETLSPASLRFSSLFHVISGLTLGFGPLQGRFPKSDGFHVLTDILLRQLLTHRGGQ